MAWFLLILAGIFEMLGVVMINRLHAKKDWQSLVLLLVTFGGSFLFLSMAMKTLPMGTAYAVWTGIGASGGAILGMIFYGEPRDWKRFVFIALIISSAVGLKLVG
ncbi:DMT family transporter [Bacillus sinesaloumensis]|uniref:DMT family transporter n=1 Tax=Litchfieldia sinesaloumensis TaxID=1926280 RepID=UPI0009884176|nr:multidrug efflux SMR transporter [Bacillus sinesaloumensis]